MTKIVQTIMPLDLINAQPQPVVVTAAVETAPAIPAEVAIPYEIPFVPPAGIKTVQMNVMGSHGKTIPVLFDPQSRTTYPLPTK